MKLASDFLAGQGVPKLVNVQIWAWRKSFSDVFGEAEMCVLPSLRLRDDFSSASFFGPGLLYLNQKGSDVELGSYVRTLQYSDLRDGSL